MLAGLITGACDGGHKPAESGPRKLTDTRLMGAGRVVSATTQGDVLTVTAERGPYSSDEGWRGGTAEAAMVVGRQLQLYDFPEETPEFGHLAMIVGPPGGPPVLRAVWDKDALLALNLDDESGASYEEVMAAASAIERLCGDGTSVPCAKVAE
jgi:hypothetical protein